MNYPVWELTTIGGGSLIALIAVLHVFISHLAVGGGLFLWLTDLKGYRENNPQIHSYVEKHTWFFLLLTMVFGGVTGVGIWFIIALVNPAATSILIHNFVFGWAIEWVFFIGEIAALLIYHYRFSSMTRRARLRISFLYFLFAWLSLVIIDGIVSFMLTPGKWLETQSFWDGFFNPTYFSSLFFRSFMCIMVAGMFGYITTVFLKESNFRHTMMKYNSKWLLYPFPGLILSGLWYFYSIPVEVRETAFALNPQTPLYIFLLLSGSAILLAGGITAVLKASLTFQRILTFIVIITGLVWMGGFEFTREITRRPWIIGQYMYSTSILKEQASEINDSGLLHLAKWTAVNDVAPGKELEAGREIFNIQCLCCHTVKGFKNDITEKLSPYTHLGILSLLTGQGKIRNYMPPFLGTEKEREALAEYLALEIAEKNINTESPGISAKPLTEQIPGFDEKGDEYILLVWNDLGMHCISDSDPWFVILPPANTLEAQLIKRGKTPELVFENILLRYEVEKGFENPSNHVDFWKYAEFNFGAKPEKNIGLFGYGIRGEFRYNNDRNSFIAEAIPVVPYNDNGTYNPYPAFTVSAVDSTGKELIKTRVVAPTSTEMGCRNCHEGGWRVNNMSGIDSMTSKNLLAVHDRINKTDLLENALKGEPKLCQSCHADPALGADGKKEVLNLAAAMHGWHANYMPYNDARACVKCHPAFEKGNTRCLRGVHNTAGLTCINCHGTMQEHALSLLRNEEKKPAAEKLMENLRPSSVKRISEVRPRMPWANEPRCLGCHTGFSKPAEGATGFNTWNSKFNELYRIRTDKTGIRCEACHGSTHALYPADNPFSKDRDNLQPLQYTKEPYPVGSNFNCRVCHTVNMKNASVHHQNMERMIRVKAHGPDQASD